MNHATTAAPHLIALFAVFPMLIVAGIFILSARVRPGIFFGVSVPPAFADSPAARAILVTYRTEVAALTLLAMSTTLPAVLHEMPWLTPAAFPTLILGCLVCWWLARRRVLPHAIQHPMERSASLGAHAGNAVFALAPAALLPLIAAWIYLRAHLAEVPARFPRHWDLAGHVNGWGSRSLSSLALPLAMGAGIVLLMSLMTAFILWAPTAERARARAVLVPTTISVTWAMSLLFSFISLAPLFRGSQSTFTLIASLGHMVVILCILGWLLWQTMQTAKSGTFDSTPDDAWHAGGLFYYNPADGAVLVPKRMGWGWTLNFGHPMALWYTGAVLLLSLAFILIPILLR